MYIHVSTILEPVAQFQMYLTEGKMTQHLELISVALR